ncbi:hypothetical protein PT2222_180028 [Paraburkholderia tropica]
MSVQFRKNLTNISNQYFEDFLFIHNVCLSFKWNVKHAGSAHFFAIFNLLLLYNRL